MKETYLEKLREARFADATEGTADNLDAGSFINSRY